MSLINYTNLADGSSIEASDVNAPFNTIYDMVNGNIDSTNISATSITTSKMVPSANIETWRSESIVNFCASGCVWSQSAGLVGAMTAGVVYIGGVRVAVDAVVSKNFTASKDTYADVGADGVIDYTEVASGAAAPAIPAGHFRLARVVTSGAAITVIFELSPRNQGEIARAKIVMGVADSIIVSNIPAYTVLELNCIGIASGGTLDAGLTLNGDTGANYAFHSSGSMAAGGATTAASSVPTEGGATDNGGSSFIRVNISNITADEKLIQLCSVSQDAAGGGTVPAAYELLGKWANTAAQISSLTWANTGTGDFSVGSFIVIKGLN